MNGIVPIKPKIQVMSANTVESQKQSISDATVASARIVARIPPDKWAKSIQNALFNVPHRHAVFTIPDALWPIVGRNRFLHKVLMDAAIAAINDTISHKHRNGRLTAGAVVMLHPFSRSLGFNPHIHILVPEGGFDSYGRFIHQKFIPFNAMRKTWQYPVLTQFKAALPKKGYSRCS